MKSVEWWRTTANHIWRTYYALERDGFEWDKLSNPNKKFYAICRHILHRDFDDHDQKILQMYFTTRWGDDQYAVEDYSLKNGIPTKVIWMVIRRANRTVMEETGFLERKEENTDE